jgi:hypothetical protein
MNMATVKLDLVKDVWQEIGAFSFLFTKGTGPLIEFVNADSLPVGDVPEAMSLSRADFQVVPAPADGSYFVRTTHIDGGVFKYNEI